MITDLYIKAKTRKPLEENIDKIFVTSAQADFFKRQCKENILSRLGNNICKLDI